MCRKEDGNVRLPRHRKKVGGVWKSCGRKLPSHPKPDVPIDKPQRVGADAKRVAEKRRRKAQKAAN